MSDDSRAPEHRRRSARARRGSGGFALTGPHALTGRRLVLPAVLVVLALAGGVLTGVQLRAAEARADRHDHAVQAASDATEAPPRSPAPKETGDEDDSAAASPGPTAPSPDPSPSSTSTQDGTQDDTQDDTPSADQSFEGAGPDCGGPDSREPPDPEGGNFFTSTPGPDGDGSNGRIPRSQMSALDWCTDSRGNEQWLRSDAAAALTELNEDFRERFGENIAVDLSYRSYDEQVDMKEFYGSLAAEPGTSNHGWGTAVDVWEWEAYSFGSDRYEWLVEHGPAHGWVAPQWAREHGSHPEYWHFEYVG